jgi:hypothetical protein
MGNQYELLARKARNTPYIHKVINEKERKLNRELTPTEIFKLLSNRVVCPRCESFALRSTGWDYSQTRDFENSYGECGVCGHKGRMYPIKEYINQGLFK